MAYSQSRSPHVLDTVKKDLTHLYEQERAAFPAQVKQTKEWSQAAEERAVAEIQQLKSEGKNWLSQHPKEQARLVKLERRVQDWANQGKQGFDHFVHPEKQQQGVTAHSLSIREQCHGPGRKEIVYGSPTMRDVGAAHMELRGVATEGGAAGRNRY